MKNSIIRVLGIFALTLSLCPFFSQAQTTSFGITAEMGVPKFASKTMTIDVLPSVDIPLNFVNFGDASDVGFGVSGNVQHTFANNKAAFIAKAGIMNFKVADQGILQANVKAVPITVGGRYYIYDGFYAGADVGATMITSKLKATFLISLSESTSETVFTFAPNIGYQLNLGNTKVDLGAKYAIVGNQYNYFGITAGINIPTGKRKF